MDLALVIRLIINSSVIASFLVMIIFIIKLVFRKWINAKWHYIIWFVLLLRLAVPYMVYSPVNLSDIYKSFHNTTINGTALHVSNKTENSGVGETSANTGVQTPTVTNNKSSKNEKISFSISKFFNQLTTTISKIKINFNLIFLVWILGIIILTIYAFLYNIIFWTRVKNGTVFTDQSIIRLLEESKEKLGVRTNVSIIQTSGISIPAIFGVTRPWLLMPEKVLKSLEHDRIRYVILHELAHLKRKDIIVNWIALILQIVHWFNPFIWLAFHKMRVDREIACDAEVLSRLEQGESKKYGHTILDMVDIISGRISYAGIAGILEDKSQIRERISRISRFSNQSRKLSVSAIVIVILLGCSILVNANNISGSENKLSDKNTVETKDISSVNTAGNLTDANSTTLQDESLNKTTTKINDTAAKTNNTLSSSTTTNTTANTPTNTTSAPKTTKTKASQSKAGNKSNGDKAGIQNSDSLEEVPFDDGADQSASDNNGTSLSNADAAKLNSTKMSEIVADNPNNECTMKKVDAPFVKIDPNENGVFITNIKPDTNLQDGKSTKVTVSMEFNLVSEDRAQLDICANVDNYTGAASKNSLALSTWDITKGKGKCSFTFSVIPKHWDDGTPFMILINMVRYDKTPIITAIPYDLNITSYSKAVSLTGYKITQGITIEENSTGFKMYIDKKKLPSRFSKLANITINTCDFISDLNIQGWVMYDIDHKLVDRKYDENTPFYFWTDDGSSCAVILFYDADMNLLGYYDYEKPK